MQDFFEQQSLACFKSVISGHWSVFSCMSIQIKAFVGKAVTMSDEFSLKKINYGTITHTINVNWIIEHLLSNQNDFSQLTSSTDKKWNKI